MLKKSTVFTGKQQNPELLYWSQYSGYNAKLQENMTKPQHKKIRIETYLKMTHMFKLANKDFVVAVIHMLKDIKENSCTRNE